MVRLVYCSKSYDELPLLEIQRILGVARPANEQAEITGMLAYEAPWFLQVLEGDREVINDLYLRIAEDPRHDQITLISYAVTEERLFGAWRMGFAGSSSAFQSTLASCGHERFEPLEMDPAEALQFLQFFASDDAQTA